MVCLTLWVSCARAADRPIEPLTVCEILRDPASQAGKAVAVLGRFSFRREGMSINEETCPAKPAAGAADSISSIRLADDPKSAPKPPEIFELDAAAVNRKLKAVKEHTALRTFRFGTPDYDRWAVVYGRIETDKSQPGAAVLVRLVYRGDGVVLFLHDN